VVIVGAGLSGIGAACRLRQKCPRLSLAVLEARQATGGTWDFFRYPGMRSDSDMFTLGYPFRPWTARKAIAGAPAILQYIRDTAREHGIEPLIRLGHRVTRAAWSSAAGRWLVEAERGPGQEPARLACRFLLMCSGYYSYAHGYRPAFPGLDRFRGRVVHPQEWPADLDCAGLRVLVIGSGATAVTLIPELARQAAHVTMLQRSPSYIVAWPDEDWIADALRRRLPAGIACSLTRWKNILAGMYFYWLCKHRPERAKAMLLDGVRAALGPGFDIATHFTPRYNPWDQRLCLAPNGDFFAAVREGRTTVVTDEIAAFTEAGVRLRSGRELPADLVVTATGLELQLMGGAELVVDGEPVAPGRALSYKGAMCSDVPNLAAVFGYTNASWTLKADLIALFVCRLLGHMERRGYWRCTPRNRDPAMPRLPPVDFTSGYFQRAMDRLPHQGPRRPWRIYQNYLLDLVAYRLAPLEDGVLEFAAPPPPAGGLMAAC